MDSHRRGLDPSVPDAASLAPLLSALTRHRPDALIAPSMWQTIETAAKRLPPTSEFGFECHLLSGGSRVDLVTRISRSDGSAAIMAGGNARYPLPTGLDAGKFWPHIIDLCARWCSSGTSPDFAFDALWLEFDAGDMLAGHTQPSVAFFYVDAAAARSARDTIADIVDRVLPAMREGARDDRLAGAIAACLDATAPKSRLSHIGIPLARGGTETRVCLRLPRETVGPGLAALGLGATADHIAGAMALLDASCHATLQLALTPGVALGFGLEIGSSSAAGWKTILACLHAGGLCTPVEAAAIAGWTSDPAALGGTFPWPPLGAGRLPANPRAAADAIAWRLPSHVKLSFPADRPVSAKAYLYAGCVWPRT